MGIQSPSTLPTVVPKNTRGVNRIIDARVFVRSFWYGMENHCIAFQNKHLNRDLSYKGYGPSGSLCKNHFNSRWRR